MAKFRKRSSTHTLISRSTGSRCFANRPSRRLAQGPDAGNHRNGRHDPRRRDRRRGPRRVRRFRNLRRLPNPPSRLPKILRFLARFSASKLPRVSERDMARSCSVSRDGPDRPRNATGYSSAAVVSILMTGRTKPVSGRQPLPSKPNGWRLSRSFPPGAAADAAAAAGGMGTANPPQSGRLPEPGWRAVPLA